MDIIQFFKDPEGQQKMRKAVAALMVRERLTIREMALTSGVDPLSISRFLFKEYKAGPKLLIGIAHLLDKYEVEL